MAVRALLFVSRVLDCVLDDAKYNGHELQEFRSSEVDTYTSECRDCGETATVVCSPKKYEKFGGAFLKRCEAGILPGMSNILVGGVERTPPNALVVENFKMSGVVRFKNAKRGAKPVNELILHETVTASSRATVDVLNQRGLGVQFIIGPDGIVRQHGDLIEDEHWHAGPHNDNSVGIEVVNPYYPKYRPTNSPWTQVIDAPWAHEGKYVVPTIEQAEATSVLTDWLTTSESGLQIPRKWRGLKGRKMHFGRIPGAEKRAPGIYAHYYFGHADGCWLTLYCWLRLEAGCDLGMAYSEATRRTTGLRGMCDLSDFWIEKPEIPEG